MSKDKKILYIVTILIFAVLLISLFVDIGSSRMVTACLLLPLTVVTCLLIKKKASYSVYKREVLILMIAVGALFVILTHMSGMFFGYYKNPYFVNRKILISYVLPLATVIITAEIIRSVLLAQKKTVVDVIAYMSMVIVEMLMYSNLHGLTSFNRFMDMVGLYLFPAITANLLYHYLSRKFGLLPSLFYRLITTLYVYFVPTVSAMTDALSAGIKITLPILLWIFVAALYEEGRQKKAKKGKGSIFAYIGISATVVVMISIVMLISCQFRFGALVIATESMTGEINKGDMIIYERYEDQQIKEGQVIVFRRDGTRVVHRVVEVITVSGQECYITKGDANNSVDVGYVTKGDIIGLTDVKVAYLGYPTLWMREVLSPKK